MTPEGAKADIPADPNFMATVFMTETGEDTDINRTADGRYYALQVTGITPPAPKPLDAVREEARERFIADARTKLLDAKIKEFVETAKKEGSLASVGKALGHAPVKSMPLKRGQTDDVFSANLMGQLFGQPKGAVVSGPAGKGNGIVIARVTDVIHPEPDVSAAAFADVQRSASQQLSATAVDTLAAATRLRAGVNIHEATVKQVTGETAAQ
jgi:peptidyl-prolyl cis-trans isomerase D